MLKDKTAIISGASRGIGRAIALELAKQGCNIAFNYLKSQAEAESLEAELAALDVKAKATQVDIKDFAAVSVWVEETKATFGGLDILVNNAGIIRDKALALMSPDDWHEVINTNLGGAFNLTRAAVITFIKQKKGDIVNITSVTGVTGMPRQSNYAASKAGIIGFTRSLAQELAPYNIRVNAVAPGFIDTDMTQGLKQEYKDEIIRNIPLARFGKSQDVAKTVKFLLSNASSYITGQTIIIDGGMSLV
ncbi:MAG: 3-oxoacyl-[acyl-carrier-protein] reductase [Candidatus Omnitrophica bacterium]|nr:3-oxoacyl-[acyl-carrier-protein] reductase [Candidatus Omnitrophota bacterium]